MVAFSWHRNYKELDNRSCFRYNIPIMNMKFNILDRLSDLLHALNGDFHSTMDNQPEFGWNWLVTSGLLLVGMLISCIFLYIVTNTFFGAIVFFGTSWYLAKCITHYRENEPTRKGDSRDTSTDVHA